VQITQRAVGSEIRGGTAQCRLTDHAPLSRDFERSEALLSEAPHATATNRRVETASAYDRPNAQSAPRDLLESGDRRTADDSLYESARRSLPSPMDSHLWKTYATDNRLGRDSVLSRRRGL
jgi:hypothetical protein